MRKNFFWMLFIWFFFINIALANFDEKNDIDKISIKELTQLPQKTIDNLPAIPILTKVLSEHSKNSRNTSTSMLVIVMIERALNDLKFYYQNPTGIENNNLITAIKKFQMSIHEPETGILTFKEYSILMKNQESLLPLDITLPGFSEKPFLYSNDSYVYAEGTWTIIDKNIAFPINTSIVRCTKNTNACVEVYSYIATFDNINMLKVEIEDYQITKWDNEEIMADTFSNCTAITLIINTKQKEVSSITRNYNQSSCTISLGKNNAEKFSKTLENPMISRLVGSGFKISREYNIQQYIKREKLLNPEYLNSIKVLPKK